VRAEQQRQRQHRCDVGGTAVYVAIQPTASENNGKRRLDRRSIQSVSVSMCDADDTAFWRFIEFFTRR